MTKLKSIDCWNAKALLGCTHHEGSYNNLGETVGDLCLCYEGFYDTTCGEVSVDGSPYNTKPATVKLGPDDPHTGDNPMQCESWFLERLPDGTDVLLCCKCAEELLDEFSRNLGRDDARDRLLDALHEANNPAARFSERIEALEAILDGCDPEEDAALCDALLAEIQRCKDAIWNLLAG
jgi:hypothetical protein